MPFLILSILMQVALVIHIVKTGRNTTWIWIVVMLPAAGSLAYLIIEVLPELMGSRTARKASRSIDQLINPNRGLKTATQDYAIASTVENSLNLADECMDKGMYEEAKSLYEKSLSGVHEDDPDIMFSLAKTEFMLNHFSETKNILNRIIDKNPDYKNQEAHLLFARTLENLNEIPKAMEEYAVLADYSSGAEARYHYALLLQQQGQAEKSKALLLEIVQKSKTAGKHFRSLNREWITLAKKELGSNRL